MQRWAVWREQKGRGIIRDQRKANVGRMQEAEKEEKGQKDGKSTGNVPEFSDLSTWDINNRVQVIPLISDALF